MLETTKIKINNTYFLKLVIPPRTLNANLLFYCVETVTFSGSSITFIFNFFVGCEFLLSSFFNKNEEYIFKQIRQRTW